MTQSELPPPPSRRSCTTQLRNPRCSRGGRHPHCARAAPARDRHCSDLLLLLTWRRSKSGGGPGGLHRHRDPQRLSIAMQIHGSPQKKSRLGGDVNHRSPKGLARRPRLQSSACQRERLMQRPRPAKEFGHACTPCKLFRSCTPCTPFRRRLPRRSPALLECCSCISLLRADGGRSTLQRVINPPDRPFGRKAALSDVPAHSGSWPLPSRRGPRAAGTARFSASLSRPPAK